MVKIWIEILQTIVNSVYDAYENVHQVTINYQNLITFLTQIKKMNSFKVKIELLSLLPES